MSVSVFNVVPVSEANRQVFRYLSGLHLAAVAVIMGFGATTPLGVTALLFVLVSAGVNAWPAYRRSPFAVVASFSTCLYFVIPLAFILMAGDRFRFGEGLSELPATAVQYSQSAPWALLFLTLLFLSATIGLVLGPQLWSARDEQAGAVAVDGSLPIGLLGIVVLFATIQAAEAFLATRADGTSTGESLWQFVFFDTAYLMLLPVVMWARLTQATATAYRKIGWQFAAVLALFFLQATLGSTSKGSILTLVLLTFITPLSFFTDSPRTLCLMPTGKAIVTGIVVALWMFFVAQGLRVVIFSGETRSVATFVEAIRTGGAAGGLAIDPEAIAYRLSATLDRYVIIFHSHLYEGHSPAYAREFSSYLGKNLSNLMLMGTPYPEAYVPSSNLLVPVLQKAALFGESSKADLIRSLNTQPFSGYGVATILAGGFAPMLVLALSGALAWLYHGFRSVAARLSLLSLYWLLLQSYGSEVAIGVTVHIGVSLVIFLLSMRFWPFRSAVRLGDVRPRLRPNIP